MRNVVIGIALIVGVSAFVLARRDPAVQAQEENKSAADENLLARIEALEELVSFHTHERELLGIKERLETLEAAQSNDRAPQRFTEPASPRPTQQVTGELNKLKQDVRSLSSKLAALERSVSPLKQDISKLKLPVMRVESSVARVDLRR